MKIRRHPRPYLQAAIDDAARRIAQEAKQQAPRHSSGGIVSLDTGQPVVFTPPEIVVPAWRHPLFRDRELIEVTAPGQRGVQYVERPCRHLEPVPVESVLGELVAWLCPVCDQQLSPDFKQETTP